MSRERFVWTRFARESSASRKSALDRVATSRFEHSPAIRYYCRPVSRIVAARSLSSSVMLAHQRSSMDRSPRDPSIIPADRPARPIVRFGSDSLDSIKDQPAEKLHERRRRRRCRRRRRRVTTAINEHTEPGRVALIYAPTKIIFANWMTLEWQRQSSRDSRLSPRNYKFRVIWMLRGGLSNPHAVTV